MPFVEVHASRERDHRRLADAAENHLARVADDGRRLRARNRGVGNLGVDVDGVDDVAEAGAEHHADARFDGGTRTDERDGFVDLLNHGAEVYGRMKDE